MSKSFETEKSPETFDELYAELEETDMDPNLTDKQKDAESANLIYAFCTVNVSEGARREVHMAMANRGLFQTS